MKIRIILIIIVSVSIFGLYFCIKNVIKINLVLGRQGKKKN